MEPEIWGYEYLDCEVWEFFEIVNQLEHSDVLCQIVLGHAPERAEEISQACPDALAGVAVDFTEAVVVVVAGVLFSGVADSGVFSARSGHLIVSVGLVRVERCGGLGFGVDDGLDGGLAGVGADFEPDLAAFPPDEALHRRPVVAKSA